MVATDALIQDLTDYIEERGGWGEFTYQTGSIDIAVPGLASLEVVENVGGEGEGSHIHVVFKAVDSDGTVIYLKKDGLYDSWDGTDWDDDPDGLYQVAPVQRLITFYKKVGAQV